MEYLGDYVIQGKYKDYDIEVKRDYIKLYGKETVTVYYDDIKSTKFKGKTSPNSICVVVEWKSGERSYLYVEKSCAVDLKSFMERFGKIKCLESRTKRRGWFTKFWELDR